jgi:hypothetical protein
VCKHIVSENSSHRFPYTKLRGMFLGSFGRRWQSGCLAMAPGSSMALSAFSEETSPWKDQYMYLLNKVSTSIFGYNKRCYSESKVNRLGEYTHTHLLSEQILVWYRFRKPSIHIRVDEKPFTDQTARVTHHTLRRDTGFP